MRLLPPLCLSLLLLASCGSGGEDPEGPRPNVVVITIDTLRPDHLGFGGATRETAPFLAELASRGTVFDRAFSTSSWTAPATASLFTGLYPTRHGVVLGFFAHFQQEGGAADSLELRPMPRDRATMPEVFRDAGYTTFGLATNLNIAPPLGFDRGFDHFEHLDDLPAGDLLARLGEWKPALDAAVPFFLYLHLNDVHWPYEEHAPWFTPSEDKRANFVSAYQSEISLLDTVLRRLYEDYDLGRDTLIAVVSDHGEEFLEHGAWDHRFTLYRELTQVLFLVHGPDLGVPAQRVETNVGLVDVLPTVAELARIEEPPLGNGRSLAPLLREGERDESFLATLEERPLFAHRLSRHGGEEKELWSVMKGGWKMIEHVDPQGASQRVLFNLNRDRLDQRPVPPTRRPEVAADLGALLDEFKARGTDVHGEAESIDLDPVLLQKLKKLGYIDDGK